MPQAPDPWVRAFARQADADLAAFTALSTGPGDFPHACHRMLFLQMACEKLCKAHLLRRGALAADLRSSHAYIQKTLPAVLLDLRLRSDVTRRAVPGLASFIRHLSREIELLNPAVDRDGRRSDNCEYPWEYSGRVVSPLDWDFVPSRLLESRAGRAVVKLLRLAVDEMVANPFPGAQ